jgi:hypothetical protein
MNAKQCSSDPGKNRWKTRGIFRCAKRGHRITFVQCRRIIKLFIKGFSINEIVDRTGLGRQKVIQVLYVTKEIMLREKIWCPRGNPVSLELRLP